MPLLQASPDIPVVESEIAGITTLVHRSWTEAAREAVDEAVDEIQRPNDRTREAIIAAILLLMIRRTSRPMEPATRDAIRRSAARLISTGIQAMPVAGRGISTLFAGGPTVTAHAGTGMLELEFASGARLIDSQLTDRVETRLRDWFVEQDRVQNAPRIAPALPDVQIWGTVSDSMASRSGAASTTELRDDLNWIMGDTRAALSNAIVDAWAYRQHNIGRFLSAKEAGVRFLVARNPMDERTTPFCRWVNGQVVAVERVERQVTRAAAAVTADDKAALIRSWPFFDHSRKGMERERASIAADRAAGARVSDTEIFRRHFARVGLPPYHWRCRTIVVAR